MRLEFASANKVSLEVGTIIIIIVSDVSRVSWVFELSGV